MKVKEESGEVGLKCNIQKTKIMASSPITSCQIDGETMEQWETLFGGVGGRASSKIIADGDWSHEFKRHLLLGRKAITNLDSILKSRVITLPTKVHLVKAMVFPIAMDGCENWTIYLAEGQRIDAFELWCWRRLLRVPWTAKRSNQSILKKSVLNIHWKDWCWSWNSPILWPLDVKNLLTGKDPDAWERSNTGGEGDNRGWDGWKASLTGRLHWLEGFTDWMGVFQ